MKIFHLLRVKHYIKNILIFCPMLFSGRLINSHIVYQNIVGFVIFSFTASIVYIYNDIRDIEKDRIHPIKCRRPLASGSITKYQAYIVISLLLICILILNWKIKKVGICYLFIYLLINILYSHGGKSIPLFDVALLASGYLIRLVYGGELSETGISDWMFLTTLSAALFLGFGKRRNEMLQYGNTYREILGIYSADFLNSSCQICVILTLVFYSLTCADSTTSVAMGGADFIYTVPVVILIFLRYNMILFAENNDGDPVEIVLNDKMILVLILIYIFISWILIY